MKFFLFGWNLGGNLGGNFLDKLTCVRERCTPYRVVFLWCFITFGCANTPYFGTFGGVIFVDFVYFQAFTKMCVKLFGLFVWLVGLYIYNVCF